MVSGTTRRSRARARRSTSISQVQVLRRQPFQGVLADVAEAALVDIPQQAFFQVLPAESTGVVVTQDALHIGRRQHLADDVEHRVVVERITNLLQLVQQALEDMPLDRVRGDEIEDQAVLLLTVAVDAPHALLEAIRIPRDVVVEEDVADLQVDPLARGLSCHQHLDRALAELLLGVEPGPRRVARAGDQAAVDGRHLEAPGFELLDEVVERVLELREEYEPLILFDGGTRRPDANLRAADSARLDPSYLHTSGIYAQPSGYVLGQILRLSAQ